MARRIGLALGSALGLLLLLLLALFGFAQTAPGKQLIAGQIARALAGPGTTAEVIGLDGFVPFDLRLRRLALRDAAGPWLEVADLRLAWSPRALLRGRLEIEEVSAAELWLLRLPPSGPADETEAPFRLPELPDRLPPLVIDKLALERIELGPAVLGEAATFTLAGRLAAADSGQSVMLTLDAERLDRRTARASVDARLDLAPPALDLKASAEETGGLLAALTRQPQAGDFSLRLEGAGPLERWSGTLELSAEGLARADASLVLALAAEPTLRLDADLRPEPGVVPAELATLAGERLSVALTARQTAAQHVAVSDLKIEIAAATLTGAGDLDFDREQLSAAAELRMPDLAPFGQLIERPLAGAFEAKLEAAGNIMQPKGRLELAIDALALDPVAAERIETALDFAVLTPLDGARITLDLKGDGQAQGLRLPAEVPLPAQDIRWQLDASGSPDGPITLRSLALAADHLELQASGEGDAGSLAGTADLRLQIAALAPFTEPFGHRLDGAGTLTADLRIGAGADEIGVDLEGQAQDLAGLPPGAAELLGAAPQLAARATYRPEQGVEISRLSLEGAAASLGGTLALSLPDQGLGGTLQLNLPKLAVLAPALGQELAGALKVTASPGGTLAAPTLDLQLQGSELLLAGRPVQDLTLAGTARDLLTAPAGHLEASLAASALKLGLASDYRLRDGRLGVSGLQLTAPGTKIGGDLALDLERRLIDGELYGEVADLAAFAPLLPVSLAGQLTLAAKLAPAGQSQTVELTVDGHRLQGDFGSLQGLSLRAQVADALQAPRLDANLRLEAFRQGETEVASATLDATGALTDLAVTLTADGRALVPFDLTGRGRLGLSEAVRLRLEQLEGEFADQPLRLAQTAELTLADGRTRLGGLDLRLGAARLQASADLGPQEVNADATLAGLPLAQLGRFGAPPLLGQAGARLQLSGPADNPRGRLDLDVDGLAAEGLTFAEIPPARLTLAAQLAERRLSIDLRAEGATEQPATLTAELPLVVRLDQPVVELPEDGPISGRLDARVELARLEALAALDDQTLSGLMTVQAALGGTFGAPQLQGDLDVSGGSYANGATGTVLQDMAVQARADAQRIVIERFAATDGGNGTLSANGTVQLDPAAGFPFNLSIDLSNARLVRRDDVDATVSGAVRLDGDTAAMKLAGTVTVNRADIQIPEGTGPSVAVIQVEEIGIDGVEMTSPNAPADPLALALDLAVDLPGRVFVRGRGLESEWGGKLQVTGTTSAPRLVGELVVRRGFLDFLDRRLQLRQGVIGFGGATPPDPTIRVEATTSVTNLTVVVRIGGQALQPTLTLDSEPPLPQDEILARLLFQRETNQMTPAQAAQLALAVNRLRGGGTGLLGRARAALGVDTLDFAGGETAGASTLRAGRYLGDDVYVELEQGAVAGTSRARVEIEIMPNVSLEADTGANAQSGIGVQWRFDF
jgi:translocation and assembly module TamB